MTMKFGVCSTSMSQRHILVVIARREERAMRQSMQRLNFSKRQNKARLHNWIANRHGKAGAKPCGNSCGLWIALQRPLLTVHQRFFAPCLRRATAVAPRAKIPSAVSQ
jgi:hypothetical protein